MSLKKLLLSLLLIGLLTGLATGGWLYWEVRHYLNSPLAPDNPHTSVIVEIPRGSSFIQIVQILKQKGVIEDERKLRWLALWRKDYTKIKAGEFELNPHWQPNQLLDYLIAGKTRLYKVTIPEGLTQHEVVQRLIGAGFGGKADYEKLLTSKPLMKQFNLPELAPHLEGFLFPETYYFSASADASTVIQSMLEQFKEVFSAQYQARAQELGLTMYEILILASIIEKETGNDSERENISSVFHNRIKRRMRLESDPTVIYGLKEFDGNLTRKHLKTPTPYNTYTIRGLPPTPICNPGRRSIHSALYPAETKFLYFVAKGDGTSYFSKNLREHNKAVWRYQKRRRQK